MPLVIGVCDQRLRVKELTQVDVTLAASLLCPFSNRWMIGHRLDTNTSWPGEAIEYNRCPGHQPANGTQEAASTLRTGNRRNRHLHRWVFPEPGAWLNVERFPWRQHFLKNIAITVQQDHALTVRSRELVNEQTRATEENVRCTFLESKTVINIASRDQELMLAHLNHLAWLQA